MATMEDSPTLLSAHIQFIDTQLALVHIPIHQYTSYLHAIEKLLLPAGSSSETRHPFINISVTPIEASIVLPRELATELFEPLLSEWPATAIASLQNGNDAIITISPDDYTLMSVSGTDLSASQRVIDLTTPLALAGISIFFITTYFSDYILVPRRSQSAVVAALEARGFEMSEISSRRSTSYTHRPTTAGSDTSAHSFAPGTPPPSTLNELQRRTFRTLSSKGISPTVYEDIRLVQCADSQNRNARDDPNAMTLALLQLLLSRPTFFSLTVTDSEPASLLLEQRFIKLFESRPRPASGASGSSTTPQNMLLGAGSDVFIPIVLDLRGLPLDSTGIVCGVAGRLVGGTKGDLEGPVEMYYLSTTKAGSVMVAEEDLERANRVLNERVGDED